MDLVQDKLEELKSLQTVPQISRTPFLCIIKYHCVLRTHQLRTRSDSNSAVPSHPFAIHSECQIRRQREGGKRWTKQTLSVATLALTAFTREPFIQ